jgi:hypothetical protein
MDVNDKTLWAVAQDYFRSLDLGEGTRVEGFARRQPILTKAGRCGRKSW